MYKDQFITCFTVCRRSRSYREKQSYFLHPCCPHTPLFRRCFNVKTTVCAYSMLYRKFLSGVENHLYSKNHNKMRWKITTKDIKETNLTTGRWGSAICSIVDQGIQTMPTSYQRCLVGWRRGQSLLLTVVPEVTEPKKRSNNDLSTVLDPKE